MYSRMPTGLSAEIVVFNRRAGTKRADFDSSKGYDQHNLLRPEAVESLFILYRVTHQQKWRDHGWRIFKAFREHRCVSMCLCMCMCTRAQGACGSRARTHRRFVCSFPTMPLFACCAAHFATPHFARCATRFVPSARACYLCIVQSCEHRWVCRNRVGGDAAGASSRQDGKLLAIGDVKVLVVALQR